MRELRRWKEDHQAPNPRVLSGLIRRLVVVLAIVEDELQPNQNTGESTMSWAMAHISNQKQKIRDTLEWFRWELLENEDKLKTHIFDIQEYAKLKFCRLKRRWSVTADNTRPGDGRFFTILEKIKTWPRLGSRKVRDHFSTSKNAQQDQERSSEGGRIKARSFPAKHGDSSRVSFLPKLTKFESIREESHGGSTEATHQEVASATTHPEAPELLNVFEGAGVYVDPAVGGNLDSINIDSFPSIPSFGEEPSGIGVDPMEFPNSASIRSIPEDNQPEQSAPVSDVSQGTFSHTYPDESGWQEGSPAVHDKSVSSQVCEQPKSNYKGVRYKHKKWTTEIRPPNGKKTVWLGTYKTEEEAASAHDAGIFYFEKSPPDFNFPESLEYLMANPLNKSLDEKPKLNFIKTHARLIAKDRVRRRMGKQPAPAPAPTTWIQGHVGTESSDMSYESSLPDPKRPRHKRAKSADLAGSQKNCRSKIG